MTIIFYSPCQSMFQPRSPPCQRGDGNVDGKWWGKAPFVLATEGLGTYITYITYLYGEETPYFSGYKPEGTLNKKMNTSWFVGVAGLFPAPGGHHISLDQLLLFTDISRGFLAILTRSRVII